MLENRLKKRFRHLRKWARRTAVTCFRVYERDIPEVPVIVDWYDGEAVAWIYERHSDRTPEEVQAWTEAVGKAVTAALEIPPEGLHVKERRRQKGLQQYRRMAEAHHAKVVVESGLKLEVNLSDFLDTGLFLDHRETRAMVREKAKGGRFLNLFAYTGSFTCHAIAGGARATTSVDMSRTYIDWIRRNLALNEMAESGAHRLVQADCLAFLADEAATPSRYDLIVCDPPTFSNSKRMEVGSFSVDRDHPDLIAGCLALLAPDGELVFSTNSRSFKLDPEAMPRGTVAEDITTRTLPEDYKGKRPHRCFSIRR